jgi:flagellar hook-associated protein 2
MGIQIDGIVSGFDTTAMIGAMVGIYSIPKGLIQKDIEQTEKKKEAVAGLKNRLEDLETALEDIEDEENFKVYKANYEETDAFSVSVDGTSIAGAYDVEITALARAELEVSDGFADKSSTGVVAEGTLLITYAGTETEITLDEDNSSLTKLAALIDDIDGISAYVLDTGDVTAPYVLVVQGEDTGVDNTIEIDVSGLTGGGTVPTFTENRAASNSVVEINGIQVESDSNIISNVIPGIDFELFQETSAAETVTVTMDKDGIRKNVEAVVEAYNEVVAWVDQQSAYNADLGIKGPFVGETTVNRVMRGLQVIISDVYTSGDELNSLSLSGVETQSSGKLELDEEKFDEALDSYFDDVSSLFTNASGFGAAMKDQIDVYIDPIDGTLESFQDSLESRIDDMEDQVASYEYRIERYETRLRAQFSAMEAILGSMQGTSNYLAAFLSTND